MNDSPAGGDDAREQDVATPVGPDEIDEVLRARGTRTREATVVDRVLGTGIDVDDVRRRSSRQAHRQHMAGGLVVAVTFVLSAGAVAAAARSLVITDPPVARPPDSTTASSAGEDAAFGTAGSRSYDERTTPTRADESSSTSSTSTTWTTAPPTTAEATSTTGARGIRGIDLLRAVKAYNECRSPARWADRIALARVDYGNVVGDDREDAVVTVSCPGSLSPRHASVYSVEPAAPSGVRRIATVEPDPPTRALLSTHRLSAWRLTDVSVTGDVVESRWSGRRHGDWASVRPYTFTLRQRWTGVAWALIAPFQLTPPPR